MTLHYYIPKGYVPINIFDDDVVPGWYIITHNVEKALQ